ncbi:hypothetical protein OOK31_02455 [Streptomyces sp. NBC_00249]|uniref:hypothetical protein n=1 Tax=Streptomyces sp. NBC_00249 TaxID=2975690 RepID=UPI002259511F|nr:hypothetical protein [Streptomyces sp. NBC_00249]MCX5192762.1 hypothetical protein [Streptomyces sp. NBC_00249]
MRIKELGRWTRRLAEHERRRAVSLALWAARRRHGVGDGDTAFGYARAQAPASYGLIFVCAVDTVAAPFMLAAYPVAHLVMLVVDLYLLLVTLGLHAAAVTRPHVVGAGGVRVRRGAGFDLRIPLELIASVRHGARFPDANTQQEGVLDLAVASQTSVTLELVRPVTAVDLWGRRRQVRTVHWHADAAREAAAAVRALLPVGT